MDVQFAFAGGLLIGYLVGHVIGKWVARKKAQLDLVRSLWRQ